MDRARASGTAAAVTAAVGVVVAVVGGRRLAAVDTSASARPVLGRVDPTAVAVLVLGLALVLAALALVLVALADRVLGRVEAPQDPPDPVRPDVSARPPAGTLERFPGRAVARSDETVDVPAVVGHRSAS